MHPEPSQMCMVKMHNAKRLNSVCIDKKEKKHKIIIDR